MVGLFSSSRKTTKIKPKVNLSETEGLIVIGESEEEEGDEMHNS